MKFIQSFVFALIALTSQICAADSALAPSVLNLKKANEQKMREDVNNKLMKEGPK
jgi:hypothetical protein